MIIFNFLSFNLCLVLKLTFPTQVDCELGISAFSSSLFSCILLFPIYLGHGYVIAGIIAYSVLVYTCFFADREAAGGGLVSAEPRLEGAIRSGGRDGGDGTKFGRRK